MEIFRDIESIPDDISTVLSVGKFDGIHVGHQSILKVIKERALALGASSAVVTFDPLPCTVLNAKTPIKILTPLPVKLQLLDRLGLDIAVVLPFTRELASRSAEDFVGNILIEKLHVREIHEGSDFRFGKSASAGIDKLLEMGDKYGFGVQIHEAVRCGNHAISSTLIRTLLSNQCDDLAALMLARSTVPELQTV